MSILDRIHPDIPTYAELEQRIKELESRQKWISVKDRLPPRINEDTEIERMVSNTLLICGVDISGCNGCGFGDYSGEWRHYGSDYDCMNIVEVTHWMPLPEAPKP